MINLECLEYLMSVLKEQKLYLENIKQTNNREHEEYQKRRIIGILDVLVKTASDLRYETERGLNQ